MTRRILTRIVAPSMLASFALAVALPASAKDRNFKAELIGYEEVPAVSTTGDGWFKARLNKAGTEIEYELHYEGLVGTVSQAHIHFGQKSVNGGIVVFLCTNLGNGPAGTQPCPSPPATIVGTIVAGDVGAGAAAQGITAGEFTELVDALREGVAYANVHSSTFAGGEIRGQIR